MPFKIRIIESDQRRKLRPRRAKFDPKVSTHFQCTVLAIPELRDLITQYLEPHNLRTITAVCRTWHNYWVAQVYKRLILSRYKRTHVYPKFDVYGHLITTLSIANSRWISVLHALEFTPTLLHLRLVGVTMSYDQTRQILEKVPHLRMLAYKFRGRNIVAEEGSIALASMLKDLEDFSWEGQNTFVRVDHLLQIIKSCKKLAKLTVGDARLVSNFPVPLPKPAPAPPPPMETGTTEAPGAMDTQSDASMCIDDDTDPWTNTSLRSIDFPSMVMGLNGTNRGGESICPNLRRLMARIPNLTKVCITYTNSFTAEDWGYIIREGSLLEHIDIRPRYYSLDLGSLTLALEFIAQRCTKLKVLNASGIKTGTNDIYQRIITNNRQLQKLLARNSGIADSCLLELAKGSLTSPIFNTLQEIDLDSCQGITDAGLVKVLETSSGLRVLSARNTKAGTIHLFNGKPWACAKSLRKLELDLMPADGLLVPISAPLVLYSDKEEAQIKEKLTALTSLVYLDLRGRALTFEMVEDVSFARLERIILHVPFVTAEETGRNMLARNKALEWSKPRNNDSMLPGSHRKYLSVPVQDTLEDLDDIALRSPRFESSETTEGEKEKGNVNFPVQCCNLLGLLAIATFGTICLYLCNFSQEESLGALNRWMDNFVGVAPSFTLSDESRQQLMVDLGFKANTDDERICEATTLADLGPAPISAITMDAHDITIESLDQDVQLSIRIVSQEEVKVPTVRVIEGATSGGVTGMYLRSRYKKGSSVLEVIGVQHKLGTMDEELVRCIEEAPHACHGRKKHNMRQGYRHQKRHHHHQHDHNRHKHQRQRNDEIQPANFCQIISMVPRNIGRVETIPSNPRCTHLTLELALPLQQEICSLRLHGSTMYVFMDGLDAVFKKLKILNEYGPIKVHNVKANKVELQSVLSSIEATGLRSGHGKQLEVSAVSPTSKVLVQIAEVPTCLLEVEAVSGNDNVEAVLPTAYRGQVCLKGGKKGHDLGEPKAEHHEHNEKGRPKHLKNKVHIESMGDESHARLYYI
ncbi:hypothetical protein BGZ93_009482 [Podila epicladia]|nr:hypothetical protein BGZ92_005246 [Podila epicladia]KAG0090156.1 hypothetical protein BGZ93_009482 [Podila epicladia]